MSEETNRMKYLADEIVFDGAIETALRKHTAFIGWTRPGMSPIKDCIDNGTCGFVQTEKLRFVATCAHVWGGFEDAAKDGAVNLWLSLITSDRASAPSIAYEVNNPTLISKDTNLDLATFTFDGINSLESWRFHHFLNTPRNRVANGDAVCFLGFPKDGVREAAAMRMLGFTLFTYTVADVGHFRFILRDPPDCRRFFNRFGDNIPPPRIPGASGSPVFRLGNMTPGPMALSLAGFVSWLGSPGFTKSPSHSVGVGSKGGHEMADGDMYIPHARFIHAEGLICE